MEANTIFNAYQQLYRVVLNIIWTNTQIYLLKNFQESLFKVCVSGALDKQLN